MLNILGYRLDVCKKLVTQELVKQLYIEAAPVPQSDPPKLNFLWGDRAKIEFTKLEILTFASRVYTDNKNYNNFKQNLIVDLYFFSRFMAFLRNSLGRCGRPLKRTLRNANNVSF